MFNEKMENSLEQFWQGYIGGREWAIQFVPTAEYLSIDYSKIGLAVICGSAISLLLFFLIRSYRNTRRDALLVVDNLASELREIKARYQVLIEHSSDAVLLFDPETLALDEVNFRFCQMLGYTYEQSRQLLLSDIIYASKMETDRIVQQVVDKGYSDVEELVFRTLDGRLLDVEVSQSAVQMDLKKKILIIACDISQRKQAEADRAQMELQLQQSQKMEALGQLTGGIAHDFNNILAVILGYSHLALTRNATNKENALSHYLEEISKAGERGRDMIARLLIYSRRHTGKETVVMDPASLVKEVIKMLSPTIPSCISLKEQIVADIKAVGISPGELDQIVMNLVINARDAVIGHGHLEIRLTPLTEASDFCNFCKEAKKKALCQGDIGDAYVSLSVTDTGCGISPENFKLIFDPFFTTKGVGKGSGFGLSMVQGIVRRAGGCILMDSYLGIGTTIQILLPAIDTYVDLPTATTPMPTVSRGNGARILVIDDEAALVRYLADLLEGENYVVDGYTDSVKALNYFHANPQRIDAVITDQTMPNRTGIEIAGAMLALRPDLPVFLLSGYSDIIDEKSAQMSIIRRFFYKPVSVMELLTALNEEITSIELNM